MQQSAAPVMQGAGRTTGGDAPPRCWSDLPTSAMEAGLLRVRSQDEPGGVDSGADLQLRTFAVAQPLQADRGTPLLVRSFDRLPFSQPTVEADGEVPRRAVVNRATH